MAAKAAAGGPGAAPPGEALRAEIPRAEMLARALRCADIAVLRQTPDLLYAEAENLPPLLAAKWHIGCRDEDLFAPALAAEMRRAKLRLLAGGPPSLLTVKLAAAAPPEPEPEQQQQQQNAAAAPLSEAAALRAEAEALARAMAAEQAQSDKSPPDESLRSEPLRHESLRFFGFYSAGGDYSAAGLASGAAKAAPAAGGAQPDKSLRGEPQPDKSLWLRFSFEALRGQAGQLCGILTVAENITELRARQEMLDVLLREVSHRSKNLLAIIQSIAAQTARFSRSTAEFLQKFQGRLQSLSSSQDLVTESDWRGARLQDLIRAQMRFYPAAAEAGGAAGAGCQIEISGENPYLFPSAALHMGLALHELAVNSASYGALARGAGRIKLDCVPTEIMAETEAEAEIADSRPGLRLRWREEFPPAAAAEGEADSGAAAAAADKAAAGALNRAHFGSAVLERIVPAALNGRAEYTIKNGMIDYIITFPLENYAAE